MKMLRVAALCAPALAGCGDSSSHDDMGKGAGAMAPARTATERPLLAVPANSLLLDPFVTSNLWWGHFVTVVLPSSASLSVRPKRAYRSLSPEGVAAPIASVGPFASLGTAGKSVAIVAPFPGGSRPFAAQLWVTAGDAEGAPVAFDDGGKGLTVELLPNDSPHAYPLVQDGALQIFEGRAWVRLTLPAPVPMPQGGWFSIAIDDPNATFQLQAPQVTPSTATATPVARPRRPQAREAIVAYAEALRKAGTVARQDCGAGSRGSDQPDR